MNSYNLEETKNTPRVLLNSDSHLMEFEGDSRPEDVQKFYKPIIIWIDEYIEHLDQVTKQDISIELNCNFKLEYFNSSSAKYIMDVINKIGNINDISETITTIINWYYDEMDEDMLEAGQEFEQMLKTKFNFVKFE